MFGTIAAGAAAANTDLRQRSGTNQSAAHSHRSDTSNRESRDPQTTRHNHHSEHLHPKPHTHPHPHPHNTTSSPHHSTRSRSNSDNPLDEIVVSSDTIHGAHSANLKDDDAAQDTAHSRIEKGDSFSSSQSGSRTGTIDSQMETILESNIKMLLHDTRKMTAWRARLSILYTSGVLVPFKLIDLAVMEAAYFSLSTQERKRLQDLNLPTPISIMKMLLHSKMLNTFFLMFLFLSVVLLCIETNPRLTLPTLLVIFILEAVCIFVFSVEIGLQYLCLHTYLPNDALRKSTPWFQRRLKRYEVLLSTILLSEESAQKRISSRQLRRDSTMTQSLVFDLPATAAAAAATRKMSLHNNATTLERTSTLAQSGPSGSFESESSRWGWILLDIAATVPFYFEVTVFLTSAVLSSTGGEGLLDRFLVSMYSWSGSDAWRLFRLIRILRLFKMGQKSDRGRIIWKAISKSADGIRLLLMTVPLFVLFFSFLFFNAEMSNGYISDNVWYNQDGTPSNFQSVTDCFWLLIVTLTTVGYGDLAPRTTQGKIVMALVMFLSLFIIAFPLCMITMQYSQCAQDFSNKKLAHEEAARKLQERFNRYRKADLERQNGGGGKLKRQRADSEGKVNVIALMDSSDRRSVET
ncbi:Potassium voltage-gated channel sub G member 1 [Chytriomyces hyalinus]|nr:Potassium voltage-gated channel sub G member 1 [Chytriomyces hyalinus]